MFKAYAATEPGGKLAPFEYDPAPLGPQDVEVDVQYCGICHSDLSMIDNSWQISQYPLVPGHEIVGRVTAAGDAVKHLPVGSHVGVGWFSRSCNVCDQCLSGDHNLCLGNEQIIVGRHGGFAKKVRCHMNWAVPLPKGVDPRSAGPLFCGGITVFNPIVQLGVRPTDRVGVIGIGGLGHMALGFLRAWGCEVTAFSSNPEKEEEARKMGAHNFVNSRDADSLAELTGSLDFILVTVNVPLNWDAYIAALRPKGRLHFVGAVMEPVPFAVFPAIMGQLSVSGSPLGSPATTATMLEFCARHKVEPTIETFPLSRVNDALEHLRAGKARYRVVLEVD
jgi:uncharacterized zinc-type alcohol dehydrogenase-like protein